MKKRGGIEKIQGRGGGKMGGWVGKEEEKRGKNRPKMLRRGKEGCRKGGKRRGRYG